MPMDDIYWNSIDFGSEDESVHEAPGKHYVDPWDLENYAYIRQHLDSMESSSDEANSTSFRYVPIQKQNREQSYAAIEEVQYHRTRPRRMYSEGGYYTRDSFESDFEENPYEVNTKDLSLSYANEHRDRIRKNPISSNKKAGRDRSLSFSYGDYGVNQDIYCKPDEFPQKRESTVPIYHDTRRKPRNFGLSNYGHLKIDYSYSWNNLDKYIHN